MDKMYGSMQIVLIFRIMKCFAASFNKKATKRLSPVALNHLTADQAFQVSQSCLKEKFSVFVCACNNPQVLPFLEMQITTLGNGNRKVPFAVCFLIFTKEAREGNYQTKDHRIYSLQLIA